MASKSHCLLTNMARCKAIPNICLSADNHANLPLGDVSQKYSSEKVVSLSSL